jgi:hypothetical protein
VHHMTTTVTAAGMGEGGKGRESARVSGAGQGGDTGNTAHRHSTSGGGGKEGAAQGGRQRSSRGGAAGGTAAAAAGSAEGRTGGGVQGAGGKMRSQSAGEVLCDAAG